MEGLKLQFPLFREDLLENLCLFVAEQERSTLQYKNHHTDATDALLLYAESAVHT